VNAIRPVIAGVAAFFLLQICASLVASQIDSVLFVNVGGPMRRALLEYRAWELYRTALYFLVALAAALLVARLDPARYPTTVPVFALVLVTLLLLVVVVDGRGYYLTDIAEIFVIGIGALVGGLLHASLASARRM
jgi:hypothetical protein